VLNHSTKAKWEGETHGLRFLSHSIIVPLSPASFVIVLLLDDEDYDVTTPL